MENSDISKGMARFRLSDQFPMVNVLSCILSQICECGDRRIEQEYAHLSSEEKASKRAASAARCMFEAAEKPSIGVHDYVKRIAQYTECSPECFIIALVYVDRLMTLHEGFVLHSLNFHRLFLTSAMLSTKFYEDKYFNNSFWARVGGVSVAEMNRQEIQFLSMLQWEFNIKVQSYEQYLMQLVLFGESQGFITSHKDYLEALPDPLTPDAVSQEISKLEIYDDVCSAEFSTPAPRASPQMSYSQVAAASAAIPHTTAPPLLQASVPVIVPSTIVTPRVGVPVSVPLQVNPSSAPKAAAAPIIPLTDSDTFTPVVNRRRRRRRHADRQTRAKIHSADLTRTSRSTNVPFSRPKSLAPSLQTIGEKGPMPRPRVSSQGLPYSYSSALVNSHVCSTLPASSYAEGSAVSSSEEVKVPLVPLSADASAFLLRDPVDSARAPSEGHQSVITTFSRASLSRCSTPLFLDSDSEFSGFMDGSDESESESDLNEEQSNADMEEGGSVRAEKVLHPDSFFQPLPCSVAQVAQASEVPVPEAQSASGSGWSNSIEDCAIEPYSLDISMSPAHLVSRALM